MKTFLILFLLGFFVSCASTETKLDERQRVVGDEYTFPVIETPASIR